MSDQSNVQHYRNREAAQRALAERASDPAVKTRILELAEAHAAVAETQQALMNLRPQEHQRSELDARFGPPA